MISSCLARLLSLSSGLRLQLMISTQFNADGCLAWGKSLEALVGNDSSVPDIRPILQRLLVEPDFALSDLRHNSITSGIVSYVSAVEYYLLDIIELCLQRNSGLRKKGLAGIQIPALELELHKETKAIKRNLIRSLSKENSKGGLFSNKIKKTSTFLALPTTIININVVKSLDSVWLLRNLFAHVNQAGIDSYKMNTNQGEIVLSKQSKSEDYVNFIVELIRIFDQCNNDFSIFDRKALENWPADQFE